MSSFPKTHDKRLYENGLKFISDVFMLRNANNLFMHKYLNGNVTFSIRVLIYDIKTFIAFAKDKTTSVQRRFTREATTITRVNILDQLQKQ